MSSPSTSSKLLLHRLILDGALISEILLNKRSEFGKSNQEKSSISQTTSKCMHFVDRRLNYILIPGISVKNSCEIKEFAFTYSNSLFFFTFTVSRKPLENLLFRCCVEPKHLNSPFTMIASRVQRASHSSILCDVSTMDLPEARVFDTTFHRFRFAPGSIPEMMKNTKFVS